MENLQIDRSLIGCSLYYVTKHSRKAERASVCAYGPQLVAHLDRWQAELTTKGDPEDTTVAVVRPDMVLVSHVGPMTHARHAALKLAGITGLPTSGPNRR